MKTPYEHFNDLKYQLDRYYNDCVHYMDDDIREVLHNKLAPCSRSVFLYFYCKEHEEKFGEPFFVCGPES